MKHTPGPWMVDMNNEVMTMPRGDIKIAKIYPISELDRGEANARLIAEAPETAKERDELKEKCMELGLQLRDQQLVAHDSAIHKELLEAFKDFLKAWNSDKLTSADSNRAYAAIAKAEGK